MFLTSPFPNESMLQHCYLLSYFSTTCGINEIKLQFISFKVGENFLQSFLECSVILLCPVNWCSVPKCLFGFRAVGWRGRLCPWVSSDYLFWRSYPDGL